ncbi:hypothetical protein AMS68_004908 [Peltaster fructicola]|uniref:Uncharacterized protein n=1 Tax=Peltaster fructicola TaxID=286661 RepID=A0A6H0XXK2_9PEZI|nr:hypothetical protein AMS68_004908 [Peltaster fructicola]
MSINDTTAPDTTAGGIVAPATAIGTIVRATGANVEDVDAAVEEHNTAAAAEARKPLLRASLMPEENIKRYTHGHVYIFDDVDRHGDQQHTSDVAHEDACDRIDQFFNHNTAYRVHNVTPAETGTTRAQFMKWWKRQLASHGEDEFHIVYFHGDAFGRDETFTWYANVTHTFSSCLSSNRQFRSRPASINAFQLFQITDTSGRDCLYIMDCFVATRFERPSGLRRYDGGHSDYNVSGAMMPDGRGRFEHTSGFTVQLTEYLTEVVDRIHSRFRHWHKRRSIPELLRSDKDLVSNPLRLWASKTARDESVSRFCIEPDDIRQNGTFEWIRVYLKGHSHVNDVQEALTDNSDDGAHDSDPTGFSETQYMAGEEHELVDQLDESGDDNSSAHEQPDSVRSWATTHLPPVDIQHTFLNVDEVKQESSNAADQSDQIIDLTTENDDAMDIKQEQTGADSDQAIDLSSDDDNDNNTDTDVTMTSDGPENTVAENEHSKSAESLFTSL